MNRYPVLGGLNLGLLHMKDAAVLLLLGFCDDVVLLSISA